MLPGLLVRLARSLSKTRAVFARKIRDLFSGFKRLDRDFLDRLEEILIASDVGVEVTTHLCKNLEEVSRKNRAISPEQLLELLKSELKRLLNDQPTGIAWSQISPTVILVAGVNGTGKTTSIAKLGYLFQTQNKRVILAAGDTFRVAAIEQLAILSQRIGADLVKHQIGADPGAVTYDALEAGIARRADVVIIDTAGRLQTKTNLMRELSKISRVVQKKVPGGPHETLLVLDATTGQNALSQAQLFHEATRLTGLFLAKLDGTAKGGIVIAIKHKLGIPVKFVGIGEKVQDIEPFDPGAFVEALFEVSGPE
jgi:fused signal recognition particle receptor